MSWAPCRPLTAITKFVIAISGNTSSLSQISSQNVQSYAMPNQEAVTVAKVILCEFISRFGVPRQLHTNQGRNFRSKLFQEMCNILEIDKTRAMPLRPQSDRDGMVERFNRTLEAMLSKFVDEKQKDWGLYLPVLMIMAYCFSVHYKSALTGESKKTKLTDENYGSVKWAIGLAEQLKDFAQYYGHERSSFTLSKVNDTT